LIGLFALLGLAFLLLRTPDTDVAAMKAKYGAAPSQFVDLGGDLTVHLRDEGPRDAPVIMLLHGSNDDLHTWDAWADALKGQYRVVRFDQIGHGLTGPNPRGDYSRAGFEATIDQVADRLGIKKFTLGGNSMGGAIAASYAMSHPERLTSLVLVDAGGAPKAAPTPGNIGFKLAALPGINQLMRFITPRSLVEKSLRQSVTNQAFITDATVDRYWELLRYPGNREATITRFANL
jgi:pimeloyl-ACP methyl ester carboxylesterase